MLDKLLLNNNAYFYQKQKSLTRNKITQIFTEVSRDKLSNRYSLKEIMSVATVGDENFYYSICIFKYTKKPSFLSEPVDGIYETKFSFLLIAEYSNYIIVYKNNVSGLKTLNDFIEPIDYSIISRLFVEDETLFEKFYVSNMSTADNALRNKSLEANNLQGTISRIGAPKQVIHNMRVSNENQRTSLSLNTSRINYLGDKKILQDFLAWVVTVSKKIDGFTPRDTYLDSFAQPINFGEYVDSLEPICILIKFDKLLDEIERGNIERIYQVDDNGEEVEGFNINTFINHFKVTLNIDNEKEGIFNIDSEIDSDMRLSIASKSIRVNSPEFKKVIIDRGSDVFSDLNSFVNNRNDFIVNFSETTLIYTYRKLFRDHRLLQDLEGFLSVFNPYQQLVNTTSEKGEFSNAQTEFEQNSVFRFIVDEFVTDSTVMFCDDLNNEWADIIAVKSDSIVFYHAKHKEGQGLSASNLQDIIGQAHKNLGNLEPTDSMLDVKANEWQRTYNNDGAQTQIRRLLKGPNDSIQESIICYKAALNQPNVSRQVNLVVDFISKQQLAEGLQRLSNNETFARRNEVTQILWFVSSLIANCKELGIETYISCRP